MTSYRELPAYDRILASLESHRDNASDRIEIALRRLAGENNTLPSEDKEAWSQPKLRYAVLHHALYGATHSADRRDKELATDALMLAKADINSYSIPSGAAGEIIISESAQCKEIRDNNFEMPSFVLLRDSLDAPREKVELVKGAVAALEMTGYSAWVRDALGILVLLHERPVRQGTSSWSITALPCTVFTDYYLDAHLFAKDLLHESGHSWLRDALLVNDEEFPPEVEIFSPWKNRNRPVMAMLHTALSFSLVTNYLARALEFSPLSHNAVVYAEARVVDERKRLCTARDDFLRAIDLLRTDDIKDVLETELANAISG